MAQGVAFFLPHLFSFPQNAQYNSGEGIICMYIVGGKMRGERETDTSSAER